MPRGNHVVVISQKIFAADLKTIVGVITNVLDFNNRSILQDKAYTLGLIIRSEKLFQ